MGEFWSELAVRTKSTAGVIAAYVHLESIESVPQHHVRACIIVELSQLKVNSYLTNAMSTMLRAKLKIYSNQSLHKTHNLVGCFRGQSEFSPFGQLAALLFSVHLKLTLDVNSHTKC